MRPAPLPNLKVYLPEIRSGRGARSAARSGAGGERLPAALRAERSGARRGGGGGGGGGSSAATAAPGPGAGRGAMLRAGQRGAAHRRVRETAVIS